VGKKFFSNLLAIGSDILAAVTGQPEIAIAGNAASGGITGGWKGALLQGGTTFLGSEFLGPELGKVASLETGGAPFNFSPSFGSAIGADLGSTGGQLLAGQVIEPHLARALGVGAGQSALPSLPKLGSSTAPGAPSGGPGPGPGGAGLGINTSTAPKITPWYQQQPSGTP
jgi:hypothetical protein